MNISQRVIDWLTRYEWSRELGDDRGLIALDSDRIQVRLDSPYWTGRDAFLTLSALDLLGLPISNADEVVSWVKSLQLANGTFRLGQTVRETTMNVCAVLRMFGQHSDSYGWRRDQLIDLLHSQQNTAKRQHFEFLPRDSKQIYAELEVAAKCIGSLAALGETLPDPVAALDYVYKRQLDGGGFKRGYAKGATGSDEQLMYWGLCCLTGLNDDLRHRNTHRAAILSWQQSDGGFEALPPLANKADLYPTLLAVRSLYLLGDFSDFDQAACVAHIRRHFRADVGAFLNKVDSVDPKTLIWTYGALEALAILGEISGQHLRDRVMYTIY